MQSLGSNWTRCLAAAVFASGALGCAAARDRAHADATLSDARGTADRGDPLLAECTPIPEGGTQHGSRSVRFEAAGAAALRIAQDPEGNPLPSFDAPSGVGDGRWVALGWSSTGGGMQTLSAWLVARRAGVLAVVDRVELTGARGESALVIDGDRGALRVGVAQPSLDARVPEEWSLRVGERTLDMDAMRALPFAPLGQATVRWYAPPLAGGPLAERVAWFAASGDGFRAVGASIAR